MEAKMSRDEVSRRLAMQEVHDHYLLWDNVPKRGLTVNGRPAMTQIDPEKVGDFVLVTVRDPLINYKGDPAEQVASKLEKPELIGKSGMFTSYTGIFKGAKLTIVSGGSGSPETELLLYDFMEFSQATTYLRVGGSGGIGTTVRPGDIVVSSGVVREENMTAAYVPKCYPAVSHYEVVSAMVQAASALESRFHVGVTLSIDSDFVGAGRPGVGGYMQPWNAEVIPTYNRAGVLNGDRESAAVVTLAALFGFRGGSVCSVADNIATGEAFERGAGHRAAIDVALEGCAILNKMDQLASNAGQARWHPGIPSSNG